MIPSTFIQPDMHDKKVMMGVSAGINSAALMCYLGQLYPAEKKPQDVVLFYARIAEQSPDSDSFAMACIEYAQTHFENVALEIRDGSIIELFRKQNTLPCPMWNTCSVALKRRPANKIKKEHAIDLDLVGYTSDELRRVVRANKYPDAKQYPIQHLSDSDCMEVVNSIIGWHPAIYDLRRDDGKPAFRHNNCLPCKNMTGCLKQDGECSGQYAQVKRFYPEYFDRALELSRELDQYWGRDK